MEKKEKKYTIINNETGECLDLNNQVDVSRNTKVTKFMLDKMLKNAKNLDEVDISMYYCWLKSRNLLNKYNQIKLDGHWVCVDFLKLGKANPCLFAYAAQLLEMSHTYTNILMKNKKTWITSWLELYEELGITNKKTRPNFKKFCTDYDIVRIDKTLKGKDENKFTTKLILNPFLMRKSSHISQPAIGRYADIAKNPNTMDSYVYKYLEIIGII